MRSAYTEVSPLPALLRSLEKTFYMPFWLFQQSLLVKGIMYKFMWQSRTHARRNNKGRQLNVRSL